MAKVTITMEDTDSGKLNVYYDAVDLPETEDAPATQAELLATAVAQFIQKLAENNEAEGAKTYGELRYD